MKSLKNTYLYNSKFKLGSTINFSLIILTLSLLLVACGNSTTSSTNPATTANTGKQAVAANDPAKIDPCTLITKDDVETVLAGTVSKQKNSTQGPTIICSYGIENSNFAVSSVLVTIETQPSSKSKFESMVSSSASVFDAKPQVISNLGDDAYSMSDTFLFVLKGNVSFNLYFPFGDKEPGTMEKAKSLALKAITRL